ncbi:hypothetical protein [Arsukibacterium sp.]|uniref:hypothetical protein n=1 Tax=Arsukibacterium sp. TaxID=1977258 RepID=UPI002FDB196E
MLTGYRWLAAKLKPLQRLLQWLALLLFALFIYLLLFAPAGRSQLWQFPVLSALISCLCLLLITLCFATDPLSIRPSGLWPGIKYRLHILGLKLLAVVVSLVSLVAIYLGLRAVLSIIANSFF